MARWTHARSMKFTPTRKTLKLVFVLDDTTGTGFARQLAARRRVWQRCVDALPCGFAKLLSRILVGERAFGGPTATACHP